MKAIITKLGIELLWLLGSLAFTLLLGFLVLGNSLFADTIDLHFHDTMYVIAASYIWIPLFFIVALLTYLIKESRHSFSRSLPNWILILTGIIFIIVLNFILRAFSQVFSQSWIADPSRPASDSSVLIQDPWSGRLTTVISITQLLILVTLLFVVYRWGNQKQKMQVEN